MNMTVKRIVIVSAAIAVQWFSISPPVHAQYWQQIETRPSYSYQPAAFRVGDNVVVSVDRARLMKGTDTLAVLDKGQSFEVRDIQGPWLGSAIESGGQKIKGWVWSSHVTLAGESSAETADRAAARPGAERRSFSYEPTERRSFSYEPSYGSRPRSSSSGASGKPAWQYPKTDPRRYRP